MAPKTRLAAMKIAFVILLFAAWVAGLIIGLPAGS
jgi:hypothetical protein